MTQVVELLPSKYKALLSWKFKKSKKRIIIYNPLIW
jgi:hypothetical protein